MALWDIESERARLRQLSKLKDVKDTLPSGQFCPDGEGRVVLPSRIREALGVKDGGEVLIRLNGNRVIIERASVDFKAKTAEWGKLARALKAERAGRVVVKVNPRGTSEGLSYENPLRDWISANRIKMRGRDYPKTPVETEPLLVEIPAIIVEAGSPLR